jgi:predicted outer membrane protein
LDHKKKSKEVNESVITEKKVKVNMKKTITKLTKLQRLNLQLAEERKQYILQRISNGNKQFEEDLRSEWFADHPGLEEMSASSISPSCISESSEMSEFPG